MLRLSSIVLLLEVVVKDSFCSDGFMVLCLKNEDFDFVEVIYSHRKKFEKYRKYKEVTQIHSKS